LINNEEINADFHHESMLSNENISYNEDKNNVKGFPRTVTTVTTVTNHDVSKPVNYNIPTNMPDDLYRLYERGDKWGCKNCNDTGDKWYMLKHNCKINKK
jgi:hypothetical protein